MGGVMKFYQSGKALADEMKIDVATLKKTFEDYNVNGEKQIKDPDGGPYDAYPSGKSWDTWGKKFYHNLPVEVDDEFHVAIVTPVIHYCMGGLQVTDKSEVEDTKGKAIPGLYAAGEIAGGVHGNNRLGGNSLLDCVVFGRVAGKAAFKYISGAKGEFQMYPAPDSLKAITS